MLQLATSAEPLKTGGARGASDANAGNLETASADQVEGTRRDGDFIHVPLVLTDGSTAKAVTLDGITFPTTDQGAQAIERLGRKLRDATALVTARDLAARQASTMHQAALDGLAAAYRRQLDAKDGEIAGLRAQIPTADALEKPMTEREQTYRAARPLLGGSYQPAGKTADQIKRDVVVKRLGSAAVDGKGDEYVRACFETLTKLNATPDPMRDALRGAGGGMHDGERPQQGTFQTVRDVSPEQALQQAQQAKHDRNMRYENAWRGTPA